VLGECSVLRSARLIRPFSELLPSLITESSSGEHDDESSSRFEWLSKWWSPELAEELLLEPPDELFADLEPCLDFSCWRHLARRFLNQTLIKK